MQVLKPGIDLTLGPSPAEIAEAILAHYEAFDLDPAAHEAALAFEFRSAPEYARIRRLADGIVAALSGRIAAGHTLYAMIDGDIAQTLGGILRDELKVTNDLLILDGISLGDFDYIDLGKIRLPSFTVPVTVKSLLFSDDPRGNRQRQKLAFTPAGHAHHGHSDKHGHGHGHSHSGGHGHTYDHE
jgi:ethanolamine utilization protein EutA